MTTTKLLCQVCAEQLGEQHQDGQAACVKCRVFYQQASKDTTIRDSACVCDSEKHCRKCRFQKCLAVNLTLPRHPANPLTGSKSVSQSTRNVREKVQRETLKRSATVDTGEKPPQSPTSCFSVTAYTHSLKRSLTIEISDPHFDSNCFKSEPRNYDKSLFSNLLSLQYAQWESHRTQEKSLPESIARNSDIRKMLETSFRDAKQFANRFHSFQPFEESKKQLILFEYAIGYMFIDQATRNMMVKDDNWWILTNNTRIFNFEGHEQFRVENEFVKELVKSLKMPFQQLDVDDYECMMLKVLLLMRSSHQKIICLDDCITVTNLCQSTLLSYCLTQDPDNGMVRFGNLLFLLGQIRPAIKAFYNHTKVSNIFNITGFL
ncbi:unnamed protein product [Caenorhabditis brenneri]